MINDGPHGALMADVTGFMKSRVILSAAELDIFTALHDHPETSDGLAKRKGFHARSLARLLDALTAFDFLKKETGLYSLTEKGELLSSLHSASLLPMVLHMSHIWDTWNDLSRFVKKGQKGRRRHKSFLDSPGAEEAFIGAMDVVGRDLSREIADFYDITPFRRMLDIGGASGTYTIAFLKKNPYLSATIFDLARVIPMAKTRMEKEGLTDRVDLAAGDFYKDELPDGYDLVLLSAIIHQNDTKQNINLYRKISKALIAGGKLLIRDHIMQNDRTAPAAGTLFAINMLVNTHGGNTYTFDEVKSDLLAAGFDEIKLLRTGQRMDCLVEARKPA